MTTKQMVAAMKKWGISVVWSEEDEVWFAGKCDSRARRGILVVDANPPAYAPLSHSAESMEEAVEDYCNARDLEWDR